MPLGQTCHFPFKYGGRNISKCLPHETKGKWCSYTYDFDKDQKAGKCTKGNCLAVASFQKDLLGIFPCLSAELLTVLHWSLLELDL